MKMTDHGSVRRPQQGFSLIELLIAMVLGLTVLIGLASVYLAIKQSFHFQETTGRLQEDGTFALDSMAKDLRMAGYAGCTGITKTDVVGPPPITTYSPGSVITTDGANLIGGSNPLALIDTTNLEVTKQPFTPSNFIRGFDTVPDAMFASGSIPSTTNTSSLFFAGGSFKAVALSVQMSGFSAPLTLAADTYAWSNTTTNGGIYDMIVSDCTLSNIFKGKVTVSGGVASIDHSEAIGNSSGMFTPNTLFNSTAIVMPAEWSFYYVATRSGASTPSLYRVFFDGNTRSAPEEIISNVESMRLHYGENTNTGTPTFVADNWRTRATGVSGVPGVTDWSRVVAVRIGLMMVSSKDNANPGVTLTVPTLLGEDYTPPTGASLNRLRKEFSTTVVLRNRMVAR